MKKRTERNELIAVRLSKEESEMARVKADRLGLSVSAYMRLLLHKDEEKPM